jgi:6-phosphogluconolactonase
MVQTALFLPAKVPQSNIHPIPTNGVKPHEAAKSYAEALERFRIDSGRGDSDALFDVVLLGAGEDGHIASLFPGTSALEERSEWAISTKSPDFEWRISLTTRALESCRTCLMLVAGSNKAPMLRAIVQGADLPAARLRPRGSYLWFLDEAAAGT